MEKEGNNDKEIGELNFVKKTCVENKLDRMWLLNGIKVIIYSFFNNYYLFLEWSFIPPISDY
jgi:hypothetical protein